MKIESVNLKNFLIIKRSDIELAKGLTTVTGETGSGKSLFVSAMRALRGERIGKNFLGIWGSTGEISAAIVLEEKDEEIKKGLTEGGIEIEEGELLILRRIFGEKNGSYLNDSPVSASFLAEIFSDHIEIGSQFENRELFKKDYRMKIVDSLAGNLKDLEEYLNIFRKTVECRNEIDALSKKEDSRKREYLEYQYSELEKLETYEGEEESLQNKIKFSENRSRIIKLSSELSELLETSSKALSKAENSASSLEKIVELKDLSQRITAVSIETGDIARTAAAQFSKYDADDENIEEIEKRYNTLSTIMIKHGVSTSAALVQKMNVMSDELFEMDKIPQSIEKIKKELKSLTKNATEIALRLRSKREQHAKRLEDNILKYLIKFGMTGVRFTVAVKHLDELNETGLDEIEFSVNTIGTEKMFDISSLSGGELSRLLLAVKLVDDEEGKVLLFDEIDSSIGGETAKSAAAEMKRNSSKNQIIVVTHFPQTAAAAHKHIVVEKSAVNGEVSAVVKELTYEERVTELARMMGDSESNDLLKTARLMTGG